MSIDVHSVKELLEKYEIGDIDELEDALKRNTKIGKIENNVKNCLTADSFYTVYGVPDCRRFFEIWKNHFETEYKREHFVNYVYKIYLEEFERYKIESPDNIDYYPEIKNDDWKRYKKQFKKPILSKSNLDSYIGCKVEELSDAKHRKIVNEVLIDVICNYLSKNFNKDTLFKEPYRTVEEFNKSNLPKPHDNSEKLQGDTLDKDEREKLSRLIHRPRNEFKQLLQDTNNLDGSDSYKIELAKYAFERNLVAESLKLVESIESSSELKNDAEYLQLEAKLLSNQNKDEQAIEVLERLIEMQKTIIDTENYNLLAASIKRKAFNDFLTYGDDNILAKELAKAQDIYHSIFKINKDYYPAINSIYLLMMQVYINGIDIDKKIEIEIEKAKELWETSNIQKELNGNDWWAHISDVEFSILITKYDEAFEKLEKYLKDFDEDEISHFSIASTIKQLELYSKFCTDHKLDEFISKLKVLDKNKY